MSTLEERSFADADDSDRFAGTQRDTLTSFIKTSGELVKMTAERDALRAEVERRTLVTNAMKVSIFNLAADLADRDEVIGRVRALCDSNTGCATRDGYLLVATIRKALRAKP